MINKLRLVKLITAKTVKDFFDSFHRIGSHIVPGSKKLYKDGFPILFVQNYKVDNRPAEIHLHEDDVFFCMYGEARFVIGGRLINPWTKDCLTFFADTIKGGREVVLKEGDWLHIPAGQPHQHFTSFLCHFMVVKLIPPDGKVLVKYIKNIKPKISR